MKKQIKLLCKNRYSMYLPAQTCKEREKMDSKDKKERKPKFFTLNFTLQEKRIILLLDLLSYYNERQQDGRFTFYQFNRSCVTLI